MPRDRKMQQGESHGDISLTTSELIAFTTGMPFPWSRTDVDQMCPARGDDGWLLALAEAFHRLEERAGPGMVPPKPPDSPARPFIIDGWDFYPESQNPLFALEELRDHATSERLLHPLKCLLLQLPSVAICDPLVIAIEDFLYADGPGPGPWMQDLREPIRHWLHFLADVGELLRDGRLILVPYTGLSPFHSMIPDRLPLPKWQDVPDDLLTSFASDGRGWTPERKWDDDSGYMYLLISTEAITDGLVGTATFKNRVDMYMPHPLHWVVAPYVVGACTSSSPRVSPPLIDIPYLSSIALSARTVADLHATEDGFAIWRSGLAAATSQVRSLGSAVDQENVQDVAQDIFRATLGPAVQYLHEAAQGTRLRKLTRDAAIPVGMSLGMGDPLGALPKLAKPARTWWVGKRSRRQAAAAVDLYRKFTEGQ